MTCTSNARRYDRSIKPEGLNELARLNLFEQVTRCVVTARNMPARSPGPARAGPAAVAVFGQLVQVTRPNWASRPLQNAPTHRGRHDASVFFVTTCG